jgi:hypothetical protein
MVLALSRGDLARAGGGGERIFRVVVCKLVEEVLGSGNLSESKGSILYRLYKLGGGLTRVEQPDTFRVALVVHIVVDLSSRGDAEIVVRKTRTLARLVDVEIHRDPREADLVRF